MKRLLFCLALSFGLLSAVAQAPVAQFTENQTQGCGTLIVTFTDQSTNSPTSWYWTFGDGGTSTVQHPTHAYTSPGVYTVTLKATNSFGNNTLAKNAYIHVNVLPSPNFTGTPLSGCVPLTVVFTNTSVQGTTPITQYNWDFGDGGNSTVQNPTHVYNTPGTYQVSLSVTDQSGCTNSIAKPAYVNAGIKPLANFTWNTAFACNPPVTVNFTNTTIPNTVSCNWNFGDGGTSTLFSPSHSYAASGSYTVTLIANQNGCPDTMVHTVQVTVNNFVADFTSPQTSGCVPFTATFTDLSPGAISWSWNFGDGGTSTLQNPSHIYAAPGSYTVTLTAFDNNGCSDTEIHTFYITVWPLPNISFSGSPLVACEPPLNVNFTSTAPGGVTWSWNFGDGGIGSGQNPSHVYNATGTFTVSLTVIDNHGCTNSSTLLSYVVIDPPLPNFLASPDRGCAPLFVSFTDQTTTNSYITSWVWNFGDGSPISILQNPSHTYIDTGVYTVTLTATDSMGCTRTDSGTVKVGMKPDALFFADDTIGCHKFNVQFTDSSSSFANYWSWEFGDGGTSLLPDPDHEYTDTGYFSVQLIVGHNGCLDTMLREDYIYVLPPKPMFTATPTVSCVYPVTVQFTDQSIEPETWLWKFGDGGTSTLQNPSHTYMGPGFYDVTLIVSNSNGCTDSLKKPAYIKVSEIIPNLTQSDTAICNDESVSFLSTSYTNTFAASWTWDFGDGTTGTGNLVSHMYASPGAYDIQLIISDGLGCIDSITQPLLIRVYGLPHPHITADIFAGCAPLTVLFSDLSSAELPASLVYWYWDFGDGTVLGGAQNNPTHTYLVPGLYNVTFNVQDSKGCDSSRTYANYIYVTFPQVSFDADSIVCGGDTAFFYNTSTGDGLHYVWDFGDGSPTSTAIDPWHIYNVSQTTTFTVSLSATDTNGCDSTLTRNILISKPVANFYASNVVANCPPLFVNFNDTSSNDVLQWYWDFGDPASGTSNSSAYSDPQHIYDSSGSYDVLLIVTNLDGCTDSLFMPDYITVNGPTGTFSFSPLSGCAPLDVDFIANALSTTSYFWVFGDGNADSTFSGSLTHTFLEGGTFVPTLVLIDSIHNCTLTLISPDTINVIAGFADFVFTSYPPCTNAVTIYFTDSSWASQNIDSWFWEFGDGQTSTDQNPSHLYDQQGVFDVTLTITVDSCVYTITYDSVVSIFESPDVVFDISSVSTCFPPLYADFTIDTSTINQGVASFDWDFGDGSPHSGDQDPTHIYDSSGNFTVTITIIFDNGCQSSYQNIYDISVYPMPNAAFVADTHIVRGGDIVSFTDQSTGTGLSWYWDFGDGQTSTFQNPVHSWEVSGIYNVMMIVSTPNGCSDTAYDIITVTDLMIIPNIFTPNGDGFNDYFEVIALGYSDYLLLIYNRWGKLVYENTDPYVFWDGTINRQTAADGVYYFILNIELKGKRTTYNGTVTLMR